MGKVTDQPANDNVIRDRGRLPFEKWERSLIFAGVMVTSICLMSGYIVACLASYVVNYLIQ